MRMSSMRISEFAQGQQVFNGRERVAPLPLVDRTSVFKAHDVLDAPNGQAMLLAQSPDMGSCGRHVNAVVHRHATSPP